MLLPETDALVVRLARNNGMVVTTRMLREAGVDRHLIEARCDRLLTRVAHGVYALGPVTPDLTVRAALAAVPGSVASHRTAARLLGLAVPAAPVAEVLACRKTRRTLAGVRFRATTWLPRPDTSEVAGLPVTSLARTLCDLAGVVAPARVRHLAEQEITAGRLAPAELQACAAGYRRSGRAGSAVVKALTHELLDDEPVAASELERRMQELLREAGISGWVPQHRPPWYDGVRGVVDLAWPGERMVVELDGRRWHATTQAQAGDRRRDRAAVAHGWVTLRFGWQEVVHRPAVVVDECLAVLTARAGVGVGGQRATARGVG